MRDYTFNRLLAKYFGQNLNRYIGSDIWRKISFSSSLTIYLLTRSSPANTYVHLRHVHTLFLCVMNVQIKLRYYNENNVI